MFKSHISTAFRSSFRSSIKYLTANIITLFTLAFANAQQVENRTIIIGKVDSLFSKSLNEMRKVWVYVPRANSPVGTERYPVVYLLDGDTHFASVAGMIQQLSEAYDNTVCPKMIVVGILNTNRTRDFTPTKVAKTVYGNFSTSGGSDQFMDFLEKELVPHIESHYPVAPYRILIGHSFGGLFVVSTLVKRPSLFNSYVAIDPSVWWDKDKVVNEAKLMLDKGNSLVAKSIYLAIANTVGTKADSAKVLKDTTDLATHMRANFLFAKTLESKSGSGLRFKWKYYGNDNHFSVPLIAEYDALRFLFDYYQFPAGNFEEMTAQALESHYKQISPKLGYKAIPPERLVNTQGYVWLQRNVFDKAYAYFKLNVENYPGSANVYDSMGDYYVATGNNKNAIEYFTKALSLLDSPETKRKLEKLKTGK